MRPKVWKMNFYVRRACSADTAWMTQLVVDSSIYSVSSKREISHQEVKQTALREFQEYLRDGDDFLVLVAETEESDQVGFLLLQLNQVSDATGDQQSQVFNIAVEPKYWGTHVVNKLLREAAQETARHGHSYLVGQTTVDNRRMKATCLRLGFQVEFYEIVAACGESGIVSLPKREKSQLAHDVSRTQRKLLAKRRARRARRKERRR